MGRIAIEKLYSKEALEQIIKLYTENESYSLQKVAGLTGVKWGTVRSYLLRKGIVLRMDKKHFTEGQKQEIIAMYSQPASLKAVAKAFKCDVKTITNVMDGMGIKRRASSKQLTNPYKEDAQFRERRRTELRGENNPRWKGGISDFEYKIRCLPEYHIWRYAVYERDKYTCQDCGKQSTKEKKVMIHAHHTYYLKDIIADYSLTNIEEAIACGVLWDTNNGRCLCSSCHTLTHNRDAI